MYDKQLKTWRLRDLPQIGEKVLDNAVVTDLHYNLQAEPTFMYTEEPCGDKVLHRGWHITYVNSFTFTPISQSLKAAPSQATGGSSTAQQQADEIVYLREQLAKARQQAADVTRRAVDAEQKTADGIWKAICDTPTRPSDCTLDELLTSVLPAAYSMAIAKVAYAHDVQDHAVRVATAAVDAAKLEAKQLRFENTTLRAALEQPKTRLSDVFHELTGEVQKHGLNSVAARLLNAHVRPNVVEELLLAADKYPASSVRGVVERERAVRAFGLRVPTDSKYLKMPREDREAPDKAYRDGVIYKKHSNGRVVGAYYTCYESEAGGRLYLFDDGMYTWMVKE